ncbi:MAG TPA: IPT/TIG domain-containing protein [Solirubrobacterales bacterium]|nr:IPT/TIG domain-containing protein [Solirubrobacterales bacterium]
MGRLIHSGAGLCACALLLLVATAIAPPVVPAKPIVVGSPLTAEFKPARVREAGTYFNSALSDPGANVVSPVDGALVNWKVKGGEGTIFRLRVLSPQGGSVYRATSSTPAWTHGSPIPPWQPLRVKAGDTVGIDISAEGVIGVATTGPESAYAVWIPPLTAGAALPYIGTKTERELSFNATILPAPTVSNVAPLKLPFAKGGQVRIHGRDFQRVTSVRFGRVPARRFRVVSERLIVATVARRGNPLKAQVRVRTVAGTSEVGPGSSLEFSD